MRFVRQELFQRAQPRAHAFAPQPGFGENHGPAALGTVRPAPQVGVDLADVGLGAHFGGAEVVVVGPIAGQRVVVPPEAAAGRGGAGQVLEGRLGRRRWGRHGGGLNGGGERGRGRARVRHVSAAPDRDVRRRHFVVHRHARSDAKAVALDHVIGVHTHPEVAARALGPHQFVVRVAARVLGFVVLELGQGAEPGAHVLARVDGRVPGRVAQATAVVGVRFAAHSVRPKVSRVAPPEVFAGRTRAPYRVSAMVHTPRVGRQYGRERGGDQGGQRGRHKGGQRRWVRGWRARRHGRRHWGGHRGGFRRR